LNIGLAAAIEAAEFVRERNGRLLKVMRSLHTVGAEVAVNFVCIESGTL